MLALTDLKPNRTYHWYNIYISFLIAFGHLKCKELITKQNTLKTNTLLLLNILPNPFRIVQQLQIIWWNIKMSFQVPIYEWLNPGRACRVAFYFNVPCKTKIYIHQKVVDIPFSSSFSSHVQTFLFQLNRTRADQILLSHV